MGCMQLPILSESLFFFWITLSLLYDSVRSTERQFQQENVWLAVEECPFVCLTFVSGWAEHHLLISTESIHIMCLSLYSMPWCFFFVVVEIMRVSGHVYLAWCSLHACSRTQFRCSWDLMIWSEDNYARFVFPLSLHNMHYAFTCTWYSCVRPHARDSRSTWCDVL